MLNQQQVTKRIIGTRLKQLGAMPIARGDGSYKVDAGHAFIVLRVGDKGEVTFFKCYKNIAGIESFGGLSNLISEVIKIGKEV